MPGARPPKTSTIDFGFPFKGWSTAGPVTQQPKGTSRDLLNVRPFVGHDANDRGRGGQRPGVLRANFTALTRDGTAVQALAQVTLGGTASHKYISQGATPFLDDAFGYAVGTLGVTVGAASWQAGRISTDLTGIDASDTSVADDNVKQAFHVASAGNLVLKPNAIAGGGAGGRETILIQTNDTNPRPAAGQEYVLAFNADNAPAGHEVYLRAYGSTPLETLNPYGQTAIAITLVLTDRQTVSFFGGLVTGSLTLPAPLAGTITMSLALFNARIFQTEVVADVRVTINGTLVYDSSTGQQASGFGGLTNSNPPGIPPGAGRRPVDAGGPYDPADYHWRAGFGAHYIAANNSTITVSRFSGYPVVVTTVPPVARSVHLLGVGDGDIWDGTTAASLVDTATAALATGVLPSIGQYGGKVYAVDGVNSIVYDPTTQAVSTWTATKGTLPPGCRICCVYRGRLVLANQNGDEQNIFMSRSGDPLDFDYAPAVPDVLMPVALNASSAAGRIGQAVYALIPFQDDVMLIGCDGSLFAMTGDPAGGGAITTVSDQIGVFGQSSWCSDPSGTLYFVGTGGFFRLGSAAAQQGPQNLSADKIPQFFAAIDRSSSVVTCVWDADRHGCWIFVTPTAAASAGPGKHLWYDERTGGFFPVSFGLAGLDPLCALAFDGDGPSDRAVLLGCKDGYLRVFSPTALDDDSTAINSYCVIGPATPFGTFGDAAVQRVESIFGDDTTGATLLLLIGKDASSAAAAAPQSIGGVFTGGGRQTPVLTRFRGNTFYLRVTAAADALFWSMEMVQALASYAGPQR